MRSEKGYANPASRPSAPSCWQHRKDQDDSKGCVIYSLVNTTQGYAGRAFTPKIRSFTGGVGA